MRSNLDVGRLESCAYVAKEIRDWLCDREHPEHYIHAKNMEKAREFLHTLDLLETVLVRFEISTYFARQALQQLEQSTAQGSLAWEFWPIDVEEFFASNLLELCYQLSNAWERIQKYSDEDKAFSILSKRWQKPNEILLARHKATHFQPGQFEDHRIAQQYSILRRPYQVEGGKLTKELAQFTMPRAAELLKDSVEEGDTYLGLFRDATR